MDVSSLLVSIVADHIYDEFQENIYPGCMIFSFKKAVYALLIFSVVISQKVAAQTNTLNKLSEDPLVKIVGQKITDATAKKVLTSKGMKKPAGNYYYRSQTSNTMLNVIETWDGLFDISSYIYSPLDKAALMSVVKPSVILPLNLHWGIAEYDLVQQMGLPVWVEEAGRGIPSHHYYYSVPYKANKEKVVLVNFEFSHSGHSGEYHRLSRIVFSLYNKADVKSTGGSRVSGEQYAGHLLKGPRPAHLTKRLSTAEMALQPATVKAFEESILKEGYSLFKKFHPDFDRANINETYVKEFDGYPGKKNLVTVIVKDSFAKAKNYLSYRLLDVNGKMVWNKSTSFRNLTYDSKLKLYKTGNIADIPALPPGGRCVIMLTFYDEDEMNRPIYAQVYTKEISAVNNQGNDSPPVANTKYDFDAAINKLLADAPGKFASHKRTNQLSSSKSQVENIIPGSISSEIEEKNHYSGGKQYIYKATIKENLSQGQEANKTLDELKNKLTACMPGYKMEEFVTSRFSDNPDDVAGYSWKKGPGQPFVELKRNVDAYNKTSISVIIYSK